MGIDELFSENLKALMQEKGWNATEVANRCGLTRPYISLLLKNERQPTVSSLEKIARAFGMEGWQLIVRGNKTSEDVCRLVKAYQSADIDTRAALLTLVERYVSP